MHAGKRYGLFQTLSWSKRDIALPFVYALAVTVAYDVGELTWIGLPWLPVSVVGVAVAFYLGFKNNASYDRLWEARKIWGAIVNASRSWAFTARDMVSSLHADAPVDAAQLTEHRRRLVHRHVAWLDALRHQLRQIKGWELQADEFDRRAAGVPEYCEDLREVLLRNLDEDEVEEVLAQINPAARLLSNQSRHLGELRAAGLIDGFGHVALQELLVELMACQGKAERIKNFPFPRQYASVNTFFAWLFCILVPLGMVEEFGEIHAGMAWLAVPFSTLVCWVFLTTDRIGTWSENPFEGLPNDVPITAMARGIERDLLQMIDAETLPEPRPSSGMIQY